MFHKLIRRIQYLTIATLTLTSGCDDRAIQIAREATDRQAQQNTAMAELNGEVARGAQRLVAADSDSRQTFVQVHHDLQAERRRLDAGWGSLETERKQIAGQRRTESAWVSIVQVSGASVLVAALLGYCWYALLSSGASDPNDTRLNELLVDEFLSSERSLSLGQRPCLDQRLPVQRLRG